MRIAVRPRSLDNLLDRSICDRHGVDVFGKARDQIGISLRGEGDARAIGREGKAVDAECISLGEELRLSGRGGIAGNVWLGQIEQPQVRHLVVRAKDVVLAKALFAIFHRLGFRSLGRYRDSLGIGRPLEAIHSIFHLG